MKKLDKQKIIIWPIDPLATNIKSLENAKQVIRTWQQQNSFQIRPVSIVTPSDLHLPWSLMAPWGEKLKELTENAIKPFLKSLTLKNLCEPQVICSSARKDSMDEFLVYAKKQKAHLIVATTHERGSYDKNRIGKFTQKLIEKSSIPVLTVRPSSKIPARIASILYPTDFSKTSKKSYVRTIEIAKMLKSKIIIFHNIYEPVMPAAEITGVMIEKVEGLKNYVENYYRKQKKNAEKWIQMAKDAGVIAEYRGLRADFSLSKSILSAALEEDTHMIVLGIESHPFMRAVLKSSVREIISCSARPVLIINSRSS